ncbi:hypothetical protein C8R41DRAFT_461021 [Lentinula lateritia]|uniref:Uncharacterized protein n=1 Tax=Lentinula lateritia TaxID=40482 RepID=A0ABQ8V9Y2_9AGAR|nr:hypothetical protein C8R41DRAFT_461021 [Lentinula lateritia]
MGGYVPQAGPLHNIYARRFFRFYSPIRIHYSPEPPPSTLQQMQRKLVGSRRRWAHRFVMLSRKISIGLQPEFCFPLAPL